MTSRFRASAEPSGAWPVVLRSGDGRARVRPWWNDPHVAQLTFLDHGVVPSSTSVRVWLGELRARGFTAVRTGAVTEGGADVLRRQGFDVLQVLRLLDLSLIGWHPPRRTGDAGRTRRLRINERAVAAEIDRAAFGDQWSIDLAGIDETCAATPAHRARAIERDHLLAGYAITGWADRTGYLQRLAVHPDHHGRGLGFQLTRDSLHWMQRKRLSRAIVNTHADNVVALDLYGRMGFRILPQGLAVLGRALDDT